MLQASSCRRPYDDPSSPAPRHGPISLRRISRRARLRLRSSSVSLFVALSSAARHHDLTSPRRTWRPSRSRPLWSSAKRSSVLKSGAPSPSRTTSDRNSRRNRSRLPLSSHRRYAGRWPVGRSLDHIWRPRISRRPPSPRPSCSAKPCDVRSWVARRHGRMLLGRISPIRSHRRSLSAKRSVASSLGAPFLERMSRQPIWLHRRSRQPSWWRRPSNGRTPVVAHRNRIWRLRF